MKCFVTGATGFVGSFLVRQLLAKGHEVHALVRDTRNSGIWRISDEASHIHFVEGSLSNMDQLRVFLPQLQPDVVFHLAWEGVDSRARDSPIQLIQNVNNTLKMLELCQLADCPAFVGVGSQAEYGIVDGEITENHICKPVTAYGVSKQALSALATKFGDIAGTRVLWFRLFSAYGPKDDPNHLIPYLIKALLKGECPPLTQGEQRWDYLYVEDVVRALLLGAACPSAEGIFNLASGTVHSLRHVIELVRDMCAPDVKLRFGELPYRPDQVMHLQANIDRLQSVTGWRSETTLEAGLRKTIMWYKENSNYAANDRAS